MSPNTYKKALQPEDPVKLAEKQERLQQQEINKIARQNWLANPVTQELLQYLQQKRDTFLLRVEQDSADTQKVEDTIKILRNAIRSKLITDIEEYVKSGNAL